MDECCVMLFATLPLGMFTTSSVVYILLREINLSLPHVFSKCLSVIANQRFFLVLKRSVFSVLFYTFLGLHPLGTTRNPLHKLRYINTDS